jgi:hypothetical protein
MTTTLRLTSLSLGVLAASITAMATVADARPYAATTVCSRYTAGCVSAPIRAGRAGPEVRLPGGTWISCKRDCRQTLREESVDFWQTMDRDGRGGRRR